ncbi:RNA-directed RNA polymerase [ssRNA phage SRR6960551_4]|uniref:RNA-directed RNA polymerase n=1 Tax=ssRNA phage SRR6960551_4 TaxID=2786555 RepID=A0A8S5L5F9_9VIRU|nr:RNA-directed RNA polymerase [ssRNA phage SRR6960551_4]DAD52607.1 TPA_asm: RNA-directed RNA polymerase [ssRNA phage SRR6960551_4]
MKNKIKTKSKKNVVNNSDYIRHYYDLYPKKESKQLTKFLAFQIAQQAGPFARELKRLILADDYPGLLAYDIAYNDFKARDCRYIAAARQVLAFYSKDSELTLDGVNPAINCLKSFIETEAKCKSTNKRLALLCETEHELFSDYPFVFRIARKISQILGACPSFEEATFTFGPGSTTNVAKKRSSPLNKLNAEMQSSSRMLFSDWGRSFYNTFNALREKSPQLATAVFGMVPKNALTLRTTVTEPTLNMPAQKFLGKHIRKRLFSIGLDLKRGQTVNQSLALLGSINNEIATVDAKNASNTISIFAVYLALIQSKDWFEALNSCRSPLFKFKDGYTPYSTEMFSSMGNGFTFELETLIFYAISIVACEDLGINTQYVSTYGDDMVIPSEAYPLLVTYLNFYGFEVNETKTFTDGPFRESCGKDYFFGQNIRPFYKKDQWTNARLISFLNKDGLEHNFLNQHVRSWLIRNMKGPYNTGPLNSGDGHLVPYYINELTTHSFSRIHRSVRQRMKHGDAPGFVFKTIVKGPLRSKSHRESKTAELKSNLYPLYSIHNRPEHRKIYDCAISTKDEYFDSYGNFIEPESSFYVIDTTYDESSLESDPYVLPGGWRAKEVKMYFVNFPEFPPQVHFDFFNACRTISYS